MLPIYSQGLITTMAELQRIENQCIKAMFRLPRLTPTTYLYSSNLLPIERLAVVESVSHLHKMVNSRTKHNFSLLYNTGVHGLPTRQSNKLHISIENPALLQSIMDYNRLGEDLQQMSCSDAFKTKLKFKVMDSSCEYSVISPYFYIN